MKKLFLTVLTISLIILIGGPVFGTGEAIEDEKQESPAAIAAGNLIDTSESVLRRIEIITGRATDEVERRQKIIEDQVEERKDNFFIRVRDTIVESVNSFIDSLLEKIREPFSF